MPQKAEGGAFHFLLPRLTNARRPPHASGSPGRGHSPKGRGKTYLRPYMGSHVTGRTLIHIKRGAAGGIPGFWGGEWPGRLPSVRGGKEELSCRSGSLARSVSLPGRSLAGRPPAPRQRAPWLWAPAGRAARHRWAAA